MTDTYDADLADAKAKRAAMAGDQFNALDIRTLEGLIPELQAFAASAEVVAGRLSDLVSDHTGALRMAGAGMANQPKIMAQLAQQVLTQLQAMRAAASAEG